MSLNTIINDTCFFCPSAAYLLHHVPQPALKTSFQALLEQSSRYGGESIQWRDRYVTDFRGRQVPPAAERLVRWDARRPDVVFSRGLMPRVLPTDQSSMNAYNFDLHSYLHGSTSTVFVSAVRYYNGTDGRPTRWAPESVADMFEYEIYANGGIDVAGTMGEGNSTEQREIAFPGGIQPAFIRSARQYDANGTLNTTWVNGFFSPDRTGDEFGTKLYELPDLTCGGSIDVRYWTGQALRPPNETMTVSTVCKVIKEPLAGAGVPIPDEHMNNTCLVPRVSRASFVDPLETNLVYFFADTQFIVIDTANGGNKLVHGPVPIAQDWAALAEAGFAKVDAVLPVDDQGEVYVFSDDKYARINIAIGPHSSRLLSGPAKTEGAWPGMKEIGCKTVDAVLPYHGHKDEAYVFCGGKYAAINTRSGELKWWSEVYGIKLKWQPLAALDRIDSVLPNPVNPKEAYFFSGDRYMFIDTGSFIGPAKKIYGPSKVIDEPMWSPLKDAKFYG